MYSSLRSLEVAAQPDGGRLVLLDTDRRTAREIEADLDLAVVLAIIRCVAPRMVMLIRDKVLYAATELPPPALVAAIAASGALLEVNGVRVSLPAVEEDVDHILDRSMTAVAIQQGVKDHDLVTIEKKLFEGYRAADEGDAALWPRLVALIAAASQTLRTGLSERGVTARWRVSEVDRLGIAFGAPGYDFKLVSRAELCFEKGPKKHSLARVVRPPPPALPAPPRIRTAPAKNAQEKKAAAKEGLEIKAWEDFKESIPREGFLPLTDVVARVRAVRPKWSTAKIMRIFGELEDAGELLVTDDDRVALNNGLNRETIGKAD